MLLSNPIINAYQQADLFGKAIFLMLFLLSITTWVIFLKKFFLQKELKYSAVRFREVFQKKGINPLSVEMKEEGHPFAELYQTFKRHTFNLLNKNRTAIQQEKKVYLSTSDIDLIEANLMNQVACQMKRMEKNIFILSTTVSLAPFLGLLGTVWGILLTFSQLQTNTHIHANSTVMGGLSMALGTTVLGLLVAIPALIAYSYLRSYLNHFSGDMEDFSYELITSLELHYRKVDLL